MPAISLNQCHPLTFLNPLFNSLHSPSVMPFQKADAFISCACYHFAQWTIQIPKHNLLVLHKTSLVVDQILLQMPHENRLPIHTRTRSRLKDSYPQIESAGEHDSGASFDGKLEESFRDEF